MSQNSEYLVQETIREFTENLPPEFNADAGAYSQLLKFHKAFDCAVHNNHGTFTRCYVDEEMRVHLCASMESISVQHPAEDLLHFLIGYAANVDIVSIGEEVLEIDIAFPGVWKLGDAVE